MTVMVVLFSLSAFFLGVRVGSAFHAELSKPIKDLF